MAKGNKNTKGIISLIIELLLFFVVLGIFGYMIYGNLSVKMNFVVLVAGIMVACLDLIVILAL